MPRLVKRLAITGTLVALLAGPWPATMAQMQMPPMPFPMPKLPGKGSPTGRVAEAECPTLDKLRRNLRITEAETWASYASGNFLPRTGSMLSRIPCRLPTLIALYDSLNDDQKKKA